MEWLRLLGSETFASVAGLIVGGILTWLLRGHGLKREIRNLREEAGRQRTAYRQEILELREQIGRTSKADSILKVEQARKLREESLQLRRKRRLQDYGDMIGIGGSDD